MRCERAREAMHRWLDAPASTQIPEEVGEHIRHCIDCKAFLANWSPIEIALQNERDSAPLPPPWLASRVAAAARVEKHLTLTPFARFGRRIAVVGALSAAVAAIACAILFGIRVARDQNGSPFGVTSNVAVTGSNANQPATSTMPGR